MASEILFKQLFDQTSGTYTYLIADKPTGEAYFIDTVYEQHERDLSLLQELNLKLIACVETHCHADHITGAWLLRHTTECQILAADAAGITGLDRGLVDGDSLSFGEYSLKVIATPGHTDGCISLVLDDQSLVFTGDSLLIRGCGRTDFQQGSPATLYHSIKHKLFSLPDNCVVYPGHDYSGRTASSIGEEKRLNPRIGGQANESDFVGFLENMKLPHPKFIDSAVPANLKAGRPGDDQLPQQPEWAPVITTYSGVMEISPQWVASNRDQVHILDVRTETEIAEEADCVEGAQLIPIDLLRDRIGKVPIDKPVMTLCRSGKRSVLAFNVLRENGWEQVANINGGLLRWIEEGLPVVDSG